jgi:hypothetical protein
VAAVSHCHQILIAALTCLALSCSGLPGAAEESPGLRTKAKSVAQPGEARSTVVEIVILSADGGNLTAQQWRSALESLGISFSIRRGLEGEEVETTEKLIGTLRKVTAIGRLERSGRLVFADQAFGAGDRLKIKEWVANLQTYGAQGSPEGKPLWGLTEDQFTAVYESLTETTMTDPRDEELQKAVQKLPLPGQYSLRWSEASKKRLARPPGKNPVRQSTQGLTTATALAVMLNDYGLGFRPTRTPGGNLELVIDVPESPTDVWPVGWPLKLPRQKTAPKLFTLQQVFFDDVPLAELLAKAAQSAEIPILFDYAELDRYGKNWREIKVFYPPRQATWHTVVRDALNKGKLTFDLWQDEAGHPFLYVSTIKSKRVAAPIEK